MPDSLKDCVVVKLNGYKEPIIRVVRCPNSTTTTQFETGGKNSQTITSVVIDGVTYEKKK